MQPAINLSPSAQRVMPSRVKLYVYDLSRLLPTHLASSAAGCALTFKFAAHLHRSVSDVSYTFERQLCRKHFNDLMTVLHCSASHQMLHSDRSIAGGLLSSFAAGIGLGGASANDLRSDSQLCETASHPKRTNSKPLGTHERATFVELSAIC